MLRIAICDDQKVYRDEIVNICEQVFAGAACVCFASGEELLRSGLEFDFLFLDIEMEGIDGIQVKGMLEEQKSRIKIIFLTSHEERMIEAFGEDVIGFLRKPIEEESLNNIFKKIKRLSNREMVELEEAGTYYTVCLEDIRYIEAQDKYTCVVLEGEKHLVRRTVKEWEEILPKTNFCRVHRSYLINLSMYEKMKDEIVLEEGKVIHLSRKNKAVIAEQYKKFLRKKVEEL